VQVSLRPRNSPETMRNCVCMPYSEREIKRSA
jgi:hypothetical protein